MNNVIMMGRLTKDPVIRYSTGENAKAVARYTLAVDRQFASEKSEQTADFVSCVAFGKSAEFAEKYLKKGTKIVVQGRIQTGSYQKDGQTIYTTDVVVERSEFAESKAAQSSAPAETPAPAGDEAFMNIPEDIDEALPFK